MHYLHMDNQATNTDKLETKQATGKQFTAIIFILALATKMFLLPIFLIQATGRDAYIVMAIGGAFDLAMLGVTIAAVCLSGERNLFELLTAVFGKVAAKTITAVFALFMFFKLNICVAEALLFYADNVFTDFSVSVLIFVLLFFFVAVGKHTLRALCRLNELIIPIVVVCLAILITIVLMTGFDLANIFPSLRDPAAFKSGLFRHSAWSGDFTPLILFIGRTKTKKFTGLFGAASGVSGMCVAVFFTLVMSAAFGNVPVLVDTSTNLSSILQFSIGNVYGRIDMFSSVLWSVSVFIESALFFYATCRCVAFVIGKNAHVAISLGVCVLLYFSQVFFMTDQTIFSFVVTSYASAIATPALAAVIPLLSLVCVLIGRKKDGGISTARSGMRAEESK